ncbi:MAG: hypothetical protein D3910_06910 [Candidatus Electrothrix sp. ATG2]|nr:hypothetical protein [Candidatus Electrothrix sp. ATG2]
MIIRRHHYSLRGITMKDRKYVSALCSVFAVWCFGLLTPVSAATIYGTVTDSNGPVEGGTVEVSRSICRDFWLGATMCTSWSDSTVTTIDGRYIFADLPLDTYYVYAPSNWRETPYAYQRKETNIIEEGQSNQVDFQLEQASIISGIIRRADGEMLTADEVEHIDVQVNSVDGELLPLSFYARSIESNGNYTISGLPSGRSINVSVRGDGTVNYIPEWSIGAVSVPDPLELTGTIDITSPGSLINEVNFQLDAGATVQGRVYSSVELVEVSHRVIVTGSTAEDACSVGVISITPDAVESTTTDYYNVVVQENGSYVVTGLRPGTYYAESYHSITEHEWVTGINTDSSPDCQQAERLIVTNDNPTQVFDQRNFQVGTGGNISGTVFQTDGQTPADDIYHVRFQQSCTVAGDEPQTTVVSGQYTSPAPFTFTLF